AEPVADEPVPEEGHELWTIDDESEVGRLRELLSATSLYMADGHHRSETALYRAQEVGGGEDDASRFKVMLLCRTEDDGLMVLPTHRLVRVPEGESLGQMLAELRGWGWRSEQPAPLERLQARLGEGVGPRQVGFGLVAEGRYSYLEGAVPAAGPGTPAGSELDVTVVHE